MNKWISVKDRLPDKVPVLAYDGYNVFTAQYKYNSKTVLEADASGISGWEYEPDHFPITHWMPLPPPPELEK